MATRSSPASEVASLFRRHFGHTPPHVAQAPAPLDLLGFPADAVDGLVLMVAVGRYACVAVSPRADGRIELVCSGAEVKESLTTSDLEKPPAASWAGPVRGVLRELHRRRASVRGFNAAIHSLIPADLGAAGPAALAVATALSLRRMHPYALTATGITTPPLRDAHGNLSPLERSERVEFARLCQMATQWAGTPEVGLAAPLTSLFGKAFHALEIDCQSLVVEPVPLIGEVSLVLARCGGLTAAGKDLATGSEFGDVASQCDAAIRALGIKSLRRVEAGLLAANRSRLTERAHACAQHVVGETTRVVFAARALREDDFEQFGQYLTQSLDSVRGLRLGVLPEVDLLVESARSHTACLGTRIIGGGFGAATMSLVHRSRADEFIRAIAAGFAGHPGPQPECSVCQVVDGAEPPRARQRLAG